MKYIIFVLPLIFNLANAADINQANSITCVGDDSALKGTHQQYQSVKSSDKVRQRFSGWLFAENFSEYKSKLKFIWTPKTANGAKIEIITTEKNHNQVKIRTLRKQSLIVVSTASDPFFSIESWSFAFNFQIESLIATRVQSNAAALKAEIMTYDCFYELL